jgi:hypothetical protein
MVGSSLPLQRMRCALRNRRGGRIWNPRGYYFWCQHRAPLMIITQEETKTAKRSARLGLLALLFPSFFS